jgi:hypothetical protein
MLRIKFIVVTFILMISQVANAFDDDRQGFVFGLGVGFHSIDLDFNFNGSKTGSGSESGLSTSFKIGGGITSQFSLFYVRNASWYSAPYFNGNTTSNITYTVGISGIGGGHTIYRLPRHLVIS